MFQIATWVRCVKKVAKIWLHIWCRTRIKIKKLMEFLRKEGLLQENWEIIHEQLSDVKFFHAIPPTEATISIQISELILALRSKFQLYPQRQKDLVKQQTDRLVTSKSQLFSSLKSHACWANRWIRSITSEKRVWLLGIIWCRTWKRENHRFPSWLKSIAYSQKLG